MSTLTRSLRTFARAEDGATTAEYGIIIVVVAGIAIFVLSQLNGALTPCTGSSARRSAPSADPGSVRSAKGREQSARGPLRPRTFLWPAPVGALRHAGERGGAVADTL